MLCYGQLSYLVLNTLHLRANLMTAILGSLGLLSLHQAIITTHKFESRSGDYVFNDDHTHTVRSFIF